MIGQIVLQYYYMSDILLYTNDLELGTILSERFLHGNNAIMFVHHLNGLNNNTDLLIIEPILEDKI